MFLKVSILLCFFLGTFSSPIGQTKSSFSDYFNTVEWITRDGVVSLSIDHKFVPLWKIRDSFNILKSIFESDSEWKNEDSLYSQYACHVQFAVFKNPWNLEPHRTETGFWSMTFGFCNPDKFFKYLSESEVKLN